MIVEFRKIHEAAVRPTKAHDNDAGFDLTSLYVERTYLYHEHHTGLAVNVPPGYVGLVFPRSSISTTGHTLANAVAVIDAGYTGEIKLRFRHGEGREYDSGERVGQLVILKLPNIELQEVNSFEKGTERGSTGFGDSGR